MARSQVLTVRLPEELKKRLDTLSKATDRSTAWHTEAALEEYLKAQEWQVAEIQAGIGEADRGELIENERVIEWLNGWGTANEKPRPD